MFFDPNFMFAHTEYLYLLVLVPLFFLFFIVRLKNRDRLLQSYITVSCLKSFTGFVSRRKQIYKYSMFLMVLLFLILALAQPQFEKEKQNIKITGSEVMIVADVSKSMLVEDMGGLSRLTVMKKELNKLIKLFSGQRVGLILFAGTADLVSPLTLDHSALQLFLKTISPQSGVSQGTNFGTAFRMAMLALKRGSVIDASTPTSRVIILASDGEDNEQQTIQIAQELASQQVSIFTLGFGTRKGGMIPIYDAQKNKIAYKKNQQNKLVISRFTDSVLKKIAHTTGATYYTVSLGDNTIQKIYSDIQNLGKNSFFYQSQTKYKQGYRYFVFIAFIFGILYFFIGEKSKKNSYKWHSYLENTQ